MANLTSDKIRKMITIANQGLKLVTSDGTFNSVLNGMKITGFTEDATKMTSEMVVKHEHLNRQGTLHGGCITTIVDVMTGMNFLAHQGMITYALSVQLDVKFLTPALEGDLIEIHSSVVKPGKSLYFLRADLLNKTRDSKIVACGTHIMSINPKKEKIPVPDLSKL